ncbi:Kelch repeat-containing protein [Aquimarina algiphila]|uniref:Kelch repeat-containing protein n=1 Tax=Aquimarina algiphila TaxID=2047982 RepID=UPI00232F66F3|nr:kelch repeat-containing protein [Aquimarina algiphila]
MKTNDKLMQFVSKEAKTVLYFFITLCMLSCSSDDDDSRLGNWVDSSVFDGTPRSSAVAFTIGDKGYMGTGYDGDDYLNDFWSYDMTGNFWSQLADFSGSARSSAVAFAVGNQGFVGSGFDGDNELGDFYRYNPSTNSWNPIAEFKGLPRRAAIAFNSETTGYVGTGFDGDNDRKDFWKYSPETDTWEELVGFGGDKRREATTFSIGDKVYMGTGISNGLDQDDFWVFDTTTEVWSPLGDLDTDDYDVKRSSAVGFSIGDKGYLAGGSISGGVTTSIWEYNPVTDFWDEKTSFEGASRQDAITFYNRTKAFVALGRSSNLYLDDNWEFFPLQEENDDD